MKAGNGVSRQLLAVGIDKSFGIDFGSAERVVAQNEIGPLRIGQHVDGTDAAAAVLLGKAGDVLVQRRHPAFEPLPIMDGGVEREIVKHVGLFGAPESVPP